MGKPKSKTKQIKSLNQQLVKVKHNPKLTEKIELKLKLLTSKPKK